MIVPMKKVSVVLPSGRKRETLRELRRLGVMHITGAETETETIAEDVAALRERIALLERGIAVIADRAKKTEAVWKTDDACVAAKRILALEEEKKPLRDRRAALAKELERLRDWGDLDPAEFATLAEAGVRLSLYEMPPDAYAQIGAAAETLVFRRSKTAVLALVIGAEDGLPANLRPYRVELPEKSTAELRADTEALERRDAEVEHELNRFAGCLRSLRDAVSVLEKEVEFGLHANGMNDEALTGTVSVSWFTGYVEAENLGILTAAAREHAWGLLAEDPTEDDDVPTKLKNNKFVSLVYPLTDFLGTVPGYFEYDISAWFLGFILIFFGIIFGDGGYGLLICAVAAVPIVRALLAKKEIPPTFLLFGLFGLATILWGTLTCTWFGLAPEYLPGWLKSLSVPVLSNVYADKIWYPFWTDGAAGLTTSQNVQIFCFTLALIQLSVAHVMGAVRNRGSVKLLGDIGSILQLTGIFYVVLSLVVNGAVFGLGLVIGGVPVGTSAVVLIGIGFVMSFVFANYEGNLGQSVLASVKDIVSVLLGVVNVFSDIVSYIRLWAVGLAGAAISATVNELAGPFLGNLVFVLVAVVLLVFGHGLNMILNVLSVIVHGIRLNTLEFSSHLGMSWSGHKFKPFEE